MRILVPQRVLGLSGTGAINGHRCLPTNYLLKYLYLLCVEVLEKDILSKEDSTRAVHHVNT